eukprot:scaffold270312_cov14-Tisochrysis_lutea.AAC.1
MFRHPTGPRTRRAGNSTSSEGSGNTRAWAHTARQLTPQIQRGGQAQQQEGQTNCEVEWRVPP